ncbi:hypothetical protein ABIB40_002083 [Pedobacter sp. UYP30]|uniref:DUF3823 domain-containing protein n=1 Tax=Pedobacter sp. UYP30 TaxID=1756400 RepID=UPI00339609D3
MRIKIQHVLLCCFILAIAACKKDNYSAPSVKLTGQLTYKGSPIGLEYNQVPFNLFQAGFGKKGSVDATFAQDGSYSSLLFAGDYQFIIPNNQGPFRWNENASGNRDTVNVQLQGDKVMDIEVTPFYMVRDAQITAASGMAKATFKIEKVITDANAKNIGSVTLYINRTQFVSGADNIKSASINGADIVDLNNVSLSVAIPEIVPAQNYVFARVGIKIDGVEDMIFSPLQKITY